MSTTRLLLAALLFTALAPRATAHDGPPYPIFVDEKIGAFTLSIWTDPDVGTGTFFYYIEAPDGVTSDHIRIQASATPVDETSPAVTGSSELSEPGEPFQQIGTLEFDHRGQWSTRFEIRTTDPTGSSSTAPELSIGSLHFALDVTPPGLGAIDLLWFALPFLMLGGIWLRVLLAQRAHDGRPNPPQA